MMLPIGLSTNGNADFKSFFSGCARAGITHAELSPAQDRYGELDFSAVARLAAEHGVSLWSFHLPFMPFAKIDISSTDEKIRRDTVRYDAELIRKAAEIGIDKFVIHPSGEPIDPADRPARMRQARESLSELADIAQGCCGVICVEDLPRTCLGNCSGEMLELLSADGRLRVCFDTNHLLFENEADFVRAVGDRIVTLHVSDRDALDERHWLPGEGVVDWPSLYSALCGAGYGGVWMYELGIAPKASINRARELDYTDFPANAKTIFAGRAPERVS